MLSSVLADRPYRHDNQMEPRDTTSGYRVRRL